MNTCRACDDRFLPGSKKLVKEVRWFLSSYGIRPKSDRVWHETWEWAKKVAHSYSWRPQWPRPSEIATMYVVLLVAEMKNGTVMMQKLPYRAGQFLPPLLQQQLPAPARETLALPFPEEPDDGSKIQESGPVETAGNPNGAARAKPDVGPRAEDG